MGGTGGSVRLKEDPQIRRQQEQIRPLAQSSAAKDAKFETLSGQNRKLAQEVEQLRQAQQQMTTVMARLVNRQAGQTRVARARSGGHSTAKTNRPTRTEVARVGF
jgi:small-conductance mechanosensitive channel